MHNVLVVYYSHSGNTKKLAEQIAGLTGADLLELHPMQEYPRDYNTVVAQAKEISAKGFLPPCKPPYLRWISMIPFWWARQTWWSTMAPPVKTFLQSCRLEGKKAAVFATHGGGGFGHIEKDFRALCSAAQVLGGYAAYGASFRKADIQNWLNRNQVPTV